MKLRRLMEAATQSRLRQALREHERAARRLDKALGEAVAKEKPASKRPARSP